MMTSSRVRIDTHHHIVPPMYRRWLVDLMGDIAGRPIPEWSPESALDMMGQVDVASSILSVSVPGVDPVDGDEARRVAREVNEYAAAVVAKDPSHFGFFATLTLPDVDAALEEAVYALDELSADGVVLFANAKGIYLGDARFDPLFDELNRRDTVVFVHPTFLPDQAVLGVPPYVADFLLDTTRAAVNLARSGSLDRYPRVKFLLSHGGGFLPFAAARMAVGASPIGSLEDGLRLLRRFYLDTASTASKFSLPSLFAFADPGHVTFGTDLPFLDRVRCLSWTAALDEHLGDDGYAVNRGNAEVLFPRLAAPGS